MISIQKNFLEVTMNRRKTGYFLSHNLYIKLIFLLKLVLSLLVSILVVAGITYKKVFIDAVINSGSERNMELIFFYLFLIALVYLIPGMVNFISFWMDKIMKKLLSCELNKCILDKTIKIKYPVLEDQKTQDLISRLDGSHEKIISTMNIITSLVFSAVQFFGVIYMLKQVNLFIMLSIVVFIFLGVFLNIKSGKALYGFWQKYIKNARRYNYLSEILTERSYVLDKSIFGYTEYINGEYNKEFYKAQKENKKAGLKRFKMQSLFETTGIIYMVGCFILLAFPLIGNTISLGYYVAVTQALGTVFASVNSGFEKIPELTGYRKFRRDFIEFMELAEYEENEGKEISEVEMVEFKNVSFHYPGSKELILDSCSFKIEKGRHYAVVGENGAGKSTIIKLLLGLYEPVEGQILINGVPIKSISSKELSKNISVLFQDFGRFPLTVKENILIGNLSKKSDDNHISQLLNEVNGEDIPSKLSGGINTTLSKKFSGGSDLSGGEWQKVAIGRLLFADKTLKIFDEPTASLDPIAESEIYEMYNRKLKGKTVIFITHRLGSTKSSDEILLVKNGKIFEKGSHESLMKLNREYYKLYDSQRSLYEKQKI